MARAWRVIAIGVTAALGLCAAVGLFNAVIDPFGMTNWVKLAGINARKPERETHARLSKAADVRRVQARAIVLGSSRSNIGLRMTYPGWRAQPRYNLAFDAATPEEMYAYLQHAQAVNPLEQVVLGLDTWMLTGYPVSVQPDFDISLLARPGQRLIQLRGMVAELRVMLSLDTLRSSLAAVQRQDEPDSLAADGQRLGSLFYHAPGNELSRLGPRAYFLNYERHEIGLKVPDPKAAKATAANAGKARRGAPTSFDFIRDIVTFCRENGIDLRIYITPAHAHEMEMSALLPEWGAIEQGKRNLVEFLAQDSEFHHTPRVPLWDFSGYSVVTEEALPPENSRREMQFYWDPSHFKEGVGDWVLDRLFGIHRAGREPPGDFGRLLTRATIESVLAEIRDGHARYAQTHPEDEEFIRRNFEELRGNAVLAFSPPAD